MWHQPPRLSVPGDVESRTTEVAGPSVTAACSPPVPGIQHGSNLVRDLRGLVSPQRSRRPYPRASRSRSSDGRSSSRPRGPSAQALSRLPTRAEIWALELTEPTFDTGPAYIGRSGILRRRVGPAPGEACRRHRTRRSRPLCGRVSIRIRASLLDSAVGGRLSESAGRVTKRKPLCAGSRGWSTRVALPPDG